MPTPSDEFPEPDELLEPTAPTTGPPGAGTLVLAGTPLGNPADASARLAALLTSADLVAAEDTRRLRRLASDLGIVREGPVISFYEDVERDRLPRVLDVLAAGGTVALVTDAGMPSVSDPGFRAARAAVDAGHRVTSLPGPSAVTTALAVSGLPCDRFCFEGFVPRRPAERRARLAELADEPRTQVYFESPRRLASTLTDMASAYGSGSSGRRMPGAVQDLRGDRPRRPRGAGRLGRERGSRRDHPGRAGRHCTCPGTLDAAEPGRAGRGAGGAGDRPQGGDRCGGAQLRDSQARCLRRGRCPQGARGVRPVQTHVGIHIRQSHCS